MQCMEKSMIINFKMISYGNFARKRKQFFLVLLLLLQTPGEIIMNLFL